MGCKIFVSYKYADPDVRDLPGCGPEGSTVRSYVDVIEETLRKFTEHVYKGESDGEDLSSLSEATIWEKLRDRIYDSTLTIVLISPGMRDAGKPDREQWIPWEIAYSLRESSRRDSSGRPVTSRTNAMMAVVLPDASGGYSYYLESRSCCSKRCTTHHTDRLFGILRKNKFNRIDGERRTCAGGEIVWSGDPSYIKAITWSSFMSNPEKHIQDAYGRLDEIDSFEICKMVD